MEALRIPVGDESVSALLIRPADAKALYVFAHGAGAGMTHKAWNPMRKAWRSAAIATLRFQFPYMEKGSKRPDSPKIAHAAVRAAVAEAMKLAADLPLFAGGRSFGGRMTSQAQAISPLPGVRGLAFLGFPLHPAGKPGIERAEHLARSRCRCCSFPALAMRWRRWTCSSRSRGSRRSGNAARGRGRRPQPQSARRSGRTLLKQRPKPSTRWRMDARLYAEAAGTGRRRRGPGGRAAGSRRRGSTSSSGFRSAPPRRG